MKIQNYINGKMEDPISGNFIDNIEPATGKVYCSIPDSDEQDVEMAVQAAVKVQQAWKTLGADNIGRILNKIAEGIEENLENLAQAESTDNGKPIALAKMVDIPRAAENFRFFAASATQFASESHWMPGRAVNYTLRQPLGVVACISPWNLPLYLFTWKIAPALATGNTVVAKPSEITPATAYLLSKICQQAGLPDGVLNIIHGTGGRTGTPLVNHNKVKALSFTGGTATGALIASQLAPRFKKMSLELGGKNATIVFDDCNYDKALSTAVRAAFTNQGQICLCGSRIYVQEGIYDRFLQDFIAKVEKLKVGDPQDPASKIGAVVSKQHMEKILSHIEIAKSEGGKIEIGGHRIQLDGRCADGYFIAPTVITGLDNDCRTNQEEIFGPVATIQPFKNDEDVLALANNSNYGLACNIWTENINRATRLAEEIDAGIVWINTWLLRDLRTPFGGMKASGVGREGGWEAMRFFTEPKNVCIDYSSK